MRRWMAALGLVCAPWLALAQVAELQLIEEQAVDGMPAGNLSGLAWCGDALWAVSDREDDRLYRLDASASPWRADAEPFELPPVPDSGLPWGMRMRVLASAAVRGGEMDFEGLTCDALGNRYLVSEAHAGVLQVSPAGSAQWLTLPDSLVRQARASGMLLNFNAMLEGIAVDPQAARLWLAAERERRGVLVLHRQQSSFQCTGGCVLFAEGGSEPPPQALGADPLPLGFTDLAYHEGALYSLEPNAHRVCRRAATTGDVERCWSYADTALAESRRYLSAFGNAEALWVDAEGAWIGVDNNGQARADGERRPVIWRFAAPAGGWGARP